MRWNKKGLSPLLHNRIIVKTLKGNVPWDISFLTNLGKKSKPMSHATQQSGGIGQDGTLTGTALVRPLTHFIDTEVPLQ
jgi:hypothetical protein